MFIRVSRRLPVGDHSIAAFSTWTIFAKIEKSLCPDLRLGCVLSALRGHYHFEFSVDDLSTALERHRQSGKYDEFDRLGPIFLKGVNCYEVPTLDVWIENCYPYLNRISLGHEMMDLSVHRIWQVSGEVIHSDCEEVDLQKHVVIAREATDITEQVQGMIESGTSGGAGSSGG